MCGRFANNETIPVMRARLDAGGPEVAWSPSWNITPTRDIPVLLGGEARRLGLMRWGWNPAALGGRLLINCRGEEAHAKRMFQVPLARRRCLIPATAFYEWRPAPTRAERPAPFTFVQASGEPFAIGGLWSTVAEAGQVILMTVPANATVAPVHDRMPLVIGMDQAPAWLDPATDPGLVQRMIVPSLAASWRSWAISRAISDVHQDGPGIMEPIGS